MAWKPTGSPTVQLHRGGYVVRVDGIDTESGLRRPKQLGSYPSRRAANAAASKAASDGQTRPERETVGRLVDQWVASRVDVAAATKAQYEWAAGHIRNGVGSIPMDHLDRDDLARWLEGLATGGKYSKRSITIFRTVLRAALAGAFAAGEIRRNPAARVALPRKVPTTSRERSPSAWTEEELQTFLGTIRGHRWEGPIALAALYGLRRSELLGLRWSRVNLRARTINIDLALVSVAGTAVWSDGKNSRSRRTIPIDPGTAEMLAEHRRGQLEEKLLAGAEWEDHDLVVATKLGRPITPENFSQTLDRLVKRAGVPRLTTHGLRHTAATHTVRYASDLGEVRAAADVLGHSPEMLMRTYSHAMPESIKTVTDKIGERGRRLGAG